VDAGQDIGGSGESLECFSPFRGAATLQRAITTAMYVVLYPLVDLGLIIDGVLIKLSTAGTRGGYSSILELKVSTPQST